MTIGRILGKKSLLAAWLAVATGCVGFSIGDKRSDAGASEQTPQDSTPDAGTADAFAGGIDCIIHPSTGRPMCSGIEACPGLLVDHDVFPNCGFRPHAGSAGAYDLECACNESVCPLGIAKTCEQAARLLSTQTEAVVCTQIAEGRCAE